MVIIVKKSNLAEFTNFGMVKFELVTICNINIVKITPGKMVEINNDSRLFSLMAIYFLKIFKQYQPYLHLYLIAILKRIASHLHCLCMKNLRSCI